MYQVAETANIGIPEGGAQIDELLWNKLPSDFDDKRKNAKIGNLLTKMRKAGIITTAEKKRWKLTNEFKRTLSEE